MRSFFTIYQERAERAGRMLATDLGKRRAKATPIGCGATPAGGQAGPLGDGARRGAACHSLALPGHGGVGAPLVPAARRTG